ncbi:MAG: hypothetical protein MPK62_03605, partial [Alphaproteobacteria bacterium]|nr:hypothetical protein [Alphaproteobacteria bacterium]
MLLKDYQQNALDQLDRYLDALKEALKERDDAREFFRGRSGAPPASIENFPEATWGKMGEKKLLPAPAGAEVPAHIPRTAA